MSPLFDLVKSSTISSMAYMWTINRHHKIILGICNFLLAIHFNFFKIQLYCVTMKGTNS